MSHRSVTKAERGDDLCDELLRLSQLALDVSSDMCMWADQAGHILYANETACRALGYTKTELLTMRVMDFDACYNEKRYSHFWDEVTRSGSVKLESVYIREDGSRFPVEMTLNYARVGDKEYVFNFIRDISERKRSGAVLQESEEKFRTLAETASVGIMLFREDKYIYTNPYMQNVLGYSEDELRAMNFWEIIHPDFRELARVRGRERLQGLPAPPRYELKIITKSGETRWGDYSANVIKYGGKPTVIGVYLDITERKLAEEALRESEVGLAKAQRIAQVGSYSLDTRMDRARCSDEFYRILGIKPLDFFSLLSFLNYVYPEDRDTFEREYRRSIDQGQYYNGEFRIVRPDGEVRTIRGDGEPVLDESGRTVEMFGIIRDITERKRAEEALVKSESDLKKAQEFAHLSNWEWDLETDKVTGSEELYRMFGLNPDQDTFFNQYLELLVPEDRQRVLDARLATIKSDSPVSIDYQVVLPDGTRRFIHDEARAFYEKGKPVKVFGIALDITERKQVEGALAADRYTLMKSQEVAHIGNWAWDVETGELTGSAENDRIFGFTPGEGSRTIELVRLRVHPDDLSILDNFAANVTLHGKRESIDYRIVKPDGSVRYLNTIADKVDRDESGKVKRVYGITQDITERKRAEEVLRESEEKFRTLAESAPAAIYINQGDRLKYLNKAAEKITGYPNEERLNLSANAIIHPDFKELAMKRSLARERGEPVPSQYEVKIIAKSGEEKWVLNSAGRIVYEGKPAILGTMFDITERKQAEEALRESEEMFRAFAESARADIVLIKGDRFIYVNPERIRALGYTKEELLTMKVEDTIHPDMRELVRDRVRRRLRGEPVPSQYEVKMITKSGETLWEELSSTVIDYKGEPTILSMSFNITDRKRAEQALKEAKIQAELYLDLMSHDITNMNQALMGNLEIMDILSETGEIDRGLIDSSLKIIKRSSRMISDVKKLTQIQTGEAPQREVDVCKMLEAVKVRYSMVPDRSVTINYTPVERCMVMASYLLEDVFDNLVDNAIRHSTGPVTIDLTVDRVSLEERQYYRITVADTGPGIPDDLKKKIFRTIEEIGAGEKFKRRGFGLFLVGTLIGYYHGKVWVEDRIPGDYTKGAKFVVLLPAAEK